MTDKILYRGQHDGFTHYDIKWIDPKTESTLLFRVKVRRPTYGGNTFQDYSAAQGQRRAAEEAAHLARTFAKAVSSGTFNPRRVDYTDEF